MYSNRVCVQEVYFGGNKELENAQKYLDKIVKRIKETQWSALYKLNITDSEDNIKFQQSLQKMFGFGSVNIYWDNSYVPNAYTYPASLLLEAQPFEQWGINDLKMQKQGKYYDEKHLGRIVMCITMYFVKKLDLTPRETMSIILHEIGHNFDNGYPTLFKKSICSGLTNFIYDFSLVVHRHLKAPGEAFLQKHAPLLKKLLELPGDFKYHFNILPIDIEVLIRILANPFNAIFAFLGVSGEKFSDKFATTYGYGPEMSSVMDKFDGGGMKGIAKETIYKIPVLRTLMDMQEATTGLLLSLIDEHPFEENRIKICIEALEKDLNDPDVPKSLKPAIKKDLDLMKKTYENNINMKDREDLIVTRIRKQIMDKFY